jgi:alkylation response protein AidB-like acyl-CoA dehydrogenase
VSHAHPPATGAGDAEQFRAHAKAVLADVARKVGRTRAVAGTGDNYDRERRRDFDQLLAAAGCAGIAIPTEFGGAGCDVAQLAVVSEQPAALGISTPFNLGVRRPPLPESHCPATALAATRAKAARGTTGRAAAVALTYAQDTWY